MKIRVTLKDPDSMPDAVIDAFMLVEKPDGVDDEEWHGLREERAKKAQEAISDQWMPYGEYLVVEFDTEANTATVLPGSALK
jgi:hypothetical protein